MAIRAHYFQAAATILQALLESPNNRNPSGPEHAWQAVEWVNVLSKAAGDDPVLVMSAARLVAGFMKNPISAHCNKHELLHYAIQSARSLVAAFNGAPAETGGPTIAPIFSAPNGPAPVATSMPMPMAAPPPPAPTGEMAPPVFMPPMQGYPGAVNPVPPQAPPALPAGPAPQIPDFSDLGGMR